MGSKMKTKYSGKYSLTKSLYGLKKRKNKYSLEEAIIRDENGIAYNITDVMMQQIRDRDATTGTRGQRAKQQRASQGAFSVGAEEGATYFDVQTGKFVTRSTRASDGASRAYVMENQQEFKAIAADLGGPDEMVVYLKALQIKNKTPLKKSQISFIKTEPFRKAVVEVLYKDLEEKKKNEIIDDLKDGDSGSIDLTENSPKAAAIFKLTKFLENAAGRLEAAVGISAARDELSNVRSSLEARFTKTMPADQAKKDAKQIHDLTEELASAGIGENFLKKTIQAVARLQAADMEHIKSAAFPAGTQDWKPFPEAMQYLFDIAEGSRGQNLGRGEIAAYYHFKNIKTPDLASGVFDLETDAGASMHVKHLTGARERNQNETIPSKKDALLGAFKAAYVKQVGDGKDLDSESFAKKFKGSGKGSNIAIVNLIKWMDSNIPSNFSAQRRRDAATQWINDNIPLLNDACHKVAIDGAGVLFFRGNGANIEYKHVAPGDKGNVFFERTDASGVGITMLKDKSINIKTVIGSSKFTKAFPLL